jgi:hypothetical protein
LATMNQLRRKNREFGPYFGRYLEWSPAIRVGRTMADN